MSASPYKIVSGCKNKSVLNPIPGSPNLDISNRGPHVVRFAEILLEFVPNAEVIAEQALQGRIAQLGQMIAWIDNYLPGAYVDFKFIVCTIGPKGREEMIGSVDANFEKISDFVKWKFIWG